MVCNQETYVMVINGEIHLANRHGGGLRVINGNIDICGRCYDGFRIADNTKCVVCTRKEKNMYRLGCEDSHALYCRKCMLGHIKRDSCAICSYGLKNKDADNKAPKKKFTEKDMTCGVCYDDLKKGRRMTCCSRSNACKHLCVECYDTLNVKCEKMRCPFCRREPLNYMCDEVYKLRRL